MTVDAKVVLIAFLLAGIQMLISHFLLSPSDPWRFGLYLGASGCVAVWVLVGLDRRL